jgi:photosystem II stability/assembly factor-like uncharacterized protein
VIYAGTEGEGLFESPDGGNTWNQILEGGVEHVIFGADNNLMVVQGSIIRYSEDGGKSWTENKPSGVDSEISYLSTPLGLKRGNPLWVALSNGRVLKTQLTESSI